MKVKDEELEKNNMDKALTMFNGRVEQNNVVVAERRWRIKRFILLSSFLSILSGIYPGEQVLEV